MDDFCSHMVLKKYLSPTSLLRMKYVSFQYRVPMSSYFYLLSIKGNEAKSLKWYINQTGSKE